MYLAGFFDRILKYCLSSDISRKKVFFDSPNNEMEKENCRCRFWSNSWSKMGHGVELLDLGHLMVLSHSMHFLDIKGVAHARQRWTLTVSVPCGINKLPNRVSLLNTLDIRRWFPVSFWSGGGLGTPPRWISTHSLSKSSGISTTLYAGLRTHTLKCIWESGWNT